MLRRPPLGLIGGAVLGACAITLLLLATPVAQSVTSHIAVTLTPPYSGKPYVAVTTVTIGCGTNVSAWKAPTMNLSSGVAQAGLKSHAKSCSSATGTDGALMSVQVGLWTKSFTTTSAHHKVTVNWKVTWTSTLTATPSPPLTGHASALSAIVVVAYIYDTTNHTTFYASNGWISLNSTTTGTHTYHHSATVSLFINATLAAGHAYVIQTYVIGEVSAMVSDTGASIADANLNLATLGNGAKLTSIVRV